MLVAGLLSTGLTLAFSSIEGGMQHPTFGATWDSVTTSPVKGLTFHPTLEVNIGNVSLTKYGRPYFVEKTSPGRPVSTPFEPISTMI